MFKRTLIAIDYIVYGKSVDDIQSRRYRSVPEISRSVSQRAITLIREGNAELAAKHLEFHITDLKRHFIGYPFQNT